MPPKYNRRQAVATPQPTVPPEPIAPPEPIVYPRPNIRYNIYTGDFGELITGVKDLLVDPNTSFTVLEKVQYLVIRLEVSEADEDGLLVLMRRSDLYLLGFAVVGRGIYLFAEANKIKGFTPIPYGHAYPVLSTSRFGTSSVCTGVAVFKAAVVKLLIYIREGEEFRHWKPEILKMCVFLGEASRNTFVYKNVTEDTLADMPISYWSVYLFNYWDKVSEASYRFTGSDYEVLTREEMNLVNGVLMEGDDWDRHFEKLQESPRACNAMVSIKSGYMELELCQKNITEIIKKARNNGMRLDRVEDELKRKMLNYKKSTDHFGYMMRQLVSQEVLLLNENGLYRVKKV